MSQKLFLSQIQVSATTKDLPELLSEQLLEVVLPLYGLNDSPKPRFWAEYFGLETDGMEAVGARRVCLSCLRP